jgi:hypothetical protein
MENNLVLAHLVMINWPVKNNVVNPCNEISAPVLMEPSQITLLRLKGISVFDVTESLGMEPELVRKEICYCARKSAIESTLDIQ